MNQSTNYNFNLPEGTDLVNLLTQLIPNWSDLDTILKGVENQAFTNCTEVTSLGVHAISRSNSEGKILKWVATANFTAGDTFTVDGNVVAASTPSGATLATGAYVSGAVIIAALNSDESAMTVFVTGSNVAADSEKLGGQLPSYYAKDSDMDIAEQAITDLDNLMGTTSISAIGDGTVTGAISSINSNLPKLLGTVSSDGVKTWSQILDALAAFIPTGLTTDKYANMKITIDDGANESVFTYNFYNGTAAEFIGTTYSEDGSTFYTHQKVVSLRASASTGYRITSGYPKTSAPGSSSWIDESSNVVPVGTTYSIYI